MNQWFDQGFKRFYVFSCHGDKYHIEALKNAGGDRFNLKVFCPYYMVDINDILEKQQTVSHACEAETSVMMYLEPRLVKIEDARDFVPKLDMKDRLDHKIDTPVPGSPGNLGYPTVASAIKGKEIYARMLKALIEIIGK